MINSDTEGISKSFRTESITKYTLTFGITRCCHLQSVMATKLTRPIHKIAIRLHPMAESCTICSSHCRRPVRKLLVTPTYKECKRLFSSLRGHCLRKLGYIFENSCVVKNKWKNLFFFQGFLKVNCTEVIKLLTYYENLTVSTSVDRKMKTDNSSVSIVTRLRAGRPRFDSRQGQRFFPDHLWGPPSLISNGYWGLFFRG
jgi:hypothetical protein